MKNKKLILLGANNPQTLKLIEDINKSNSNYDFNILGWVDNDTSKVGKVIHGLEVLGTPDILEQEKYKDVYLVNNITTSGVIRKETTQQLLKYNLPFETLVHPNVNINFVKIGVGSIIHENVVLEAESCIGDYVCIASGSIVCHETKVGDYSFISSGSVIAGLVDIEESVTILLGSKITPRLKISKDSVISAGSVVFEDVLEGTTVFGNPASIIKKQIKREKESFSLEEILKIHFPKLLTIEADEYFADYELLSSFDTFQLILTLEKAFNIKIEDFEVDEDNIGSVRNLQKFLKSKVKS